jgi:hypothetical protein
MQEHVTAIQAIQALLAPALGISAVGLLLLSLNNRYSIIINRIRLLNEERRRYLRSIAEGKDLEYADNVRFMSISRQSRELLVRSRLVRNGILAILTAVLFFVLSSVLIGLNLFLTAPVMQALPLYTFITGMLSVFVGVIFAAREVARSYTIVLLEAKADE